MSDVFIVDELKRLSRRVEDLGKTIDTLIADREILEDVLLRLSSVENALHMQRSNQTEMVRDIKAEIDDVKDRVEAKIDESAIALDDKTVIVKSPKEGFITKIIEKMRGKK